MGKRKVLLYYCRHLLRYKWIVENSPFVTDSALLMAQLFCVYSCSIQPPILEKAGVLDGKRYGRILVTGCGKRTDIYSDRADVAFYGGCETRGNPRVD